MRKFVSILYLLTYCCVNNFAQGHSFKQFDLNDGLAGNIVYDIEQDALDYLWFGTNNGVSRYDGLNFQNYNDPILQNSDIILLEEMMGTMYFLNINRQLFCIQNNQIVPANAEIFKGPIYAFIHHPIGNCIWYSNQNNLFQYHLATKKSTRHEGLQNITGTSPHIFCLDQHQNLWVLSKEGIFKYQDSTTGLQKIVPAEAFPPNHNFNKISFQAKEGIYLTSSDDIAYRLSPNHQLQKIEKPILVTGNVGSYATTDDWWISNQKEVYRYHKATREVNDFTADVGYHQINKFYEDREGNIWFATDGNGLYMLNNPDVLNFNTRNSSLSSNQIQRIEVDPQQNVWLGLSDRNLMQLQGTNLQTFPYHPTRSNTQFYDLVFNQDTLFVIADRVYQVHAGKTSVFYPNQIKSFCVDSNNDIWMGAADLIFRRNRARQTDEVFMSNMRCYAIESTKEKTWFGTTRGLYFTNHDQSLNYHPKNKLAGWSLFKQQQRLDTSYYFDLQNPPMAPPAGYLTTPHAFYHQYFDANGASITADINHIGFTADGTLWLATRNIGLYYIKDQRIHQFNESHGLSSNICKDLFVDQDDNIWVATTKGLGKISYPSLQYTHYSSHDGLSSDGITSIRRSVDSTLYIGTLKGLCVTKEHQLASPVLAPSIHLRKVSINEKDTTLAHRYQLTYDQNNLVLSFMGISFKSELSYLYRLQKDAPWIPTDNTYLRLAELSPGTYHFEVKAQNVNGVQSKNPIRIEIQIAPPWWETLSFKIALFILLGGCISLLAYLRVQQIKKQEKEKTSINKRFAALELQALQAQMNPHFVFNALGAIQKFILNQEEDEASDYLTRFAQLMRLFLDSSREKYISLSNELNLLQHYLALEQLRFGDKLSYRILTDPKLNINTIEIPSMLLQPFVENAINHGLRFKAKEGLLTIRLQLKNEGLLVCTIEDNGVGRQAAAERKHQTKSAYKSRGTTIVNDRLKVLNFIEEINIQIKTHDRVNAQNQACGTTVTILIPIEH